MKPATPFASPAQVPGPALAPRLTSRPWRTARGRRSFGLLFSLALVASCAAPPTGVHVEEALFELDGANFWRAHAEASRALELDPGSPALQRLHKQTRVLWLLDLARERVFEDEEERALAILAQVRVLDPGNRIADAWEKKAREQLSREKVFLGEEALGKGQLDESLARFREAMELVPGFEPAVRGYRDVGRIFAERRENAEEHYQLALRAQLEGDWRRVLYHAQVTQNDDPSREDAKQLVQAGQRQLADAARLDGLGFEEERKFGPAARRYAEAVTIGRPLEVEWLERVDERRALMEREFEAELLLDRFEVEVAAGHFDAARRSLEEAEALTSLQRARINTAKLQLFAEQRAARLDRARLLEVDHRFDEALAIYRELVEQRDDELVRRRIERVEALLAACAELYAEAEKELAAGRPAAAAAALRQLLALHRRYRDAAQKLEALGDV